MQMKIVFPQKISSGKAISGTLFLLLIYLSSGSLDLFKEGGARPQGPTTASEAYNGPLNFIIYIWFGISAVYSATIIFRKVRTKKLQLNKTLIWLFLLALLSTTWSIDHGLAARTTLLLCVSYILTLSFIEKHTPAGGFIFLCRILLSMQIASLLTILFLPSYGVSVGAHEGKWQGIFNHKNTLGSFSAFAFLLLLAGQPLLRKFESNIGLGASFILALGSQSSTAISIMFISTLIFILTRERNITRLTQKSRFIYLIALLAFSGLAVYLAITNTELEILDKDSSFSDRNLIWAYVLSKAIQSPIIGHGVNQYSAYFLGDDQSFFLNTGFLANSAHNGFIDLFFSLGTIGLLLGTWLIFQLIGRTNGKNLLFINIAFATAFVIENTFEAKFFNFNISFIILFYILEINRIKKRQPRNNRSKSNLI